MKKFFWQALLYLPFSISQVQAGDMPFLGEIQWFAGNFAPENFAFCNGQLLNISEHEDLFNLIGTRFGGDGINNFALPNVQSRMVIHSGTGAGLTPRTIADTGGEENHTLSINEMPTHKHLFRGIASLGNVSVPSGNAVANGENFYRTEEPNVAMHMQSIGNSGGGQAHNNMSPYLTVHCIIALSGVFPSPTISYVNVRGEK